MIKYRYKDDATMVADVISGNESAIGYMFYEQYNSLLRWNAVKASGNSGVSYDDLIQELYIYLSNNGWERLRRYDVALPFVNWFSVVSYRFFKKKSLSMIDLPDQKSISTMNEASISAIGGSVFNSIMMDIRNALRRLRPPRDRVIMEALLLREESPDEVARQHGVTVDNLYNIKRRALARLIKNHLNEYIEQ